MTTSSVPATGQDVTVVIPAKDRAGVLAEAVESVRRGTVQPRAVVVIDDGSSDGTGDVARAAGAVVLTNAEPGGSGPARNRGIEHAETDWIAFLDSDDVWDADHLERALPRTPGRVLITAAARDSFGRHRGSAFEREIDSRRCFVPESVVMTSATLVRRDALMAAGLFRSLPRVQDLDMWVRVLELGPGLALPHASVTYRTSSEYTTTASDALDRRWLLEVLGSYADRPWMTRGVADGVLGRMEWDYLRLAQHERRRRQVVVHGTWFARHPRALRWVVPMILHRRQTRRLWPDQPGLATGTNAS